ncbi:glycosyl transferase [Streptacidiphilus pinicola]|uniref:Glycosyl transferase n=1 Tax=Streptacidiphilus pinicola TaxID=2219663 RepID=A0A2X0KCF7_9ACTN|nr:glycosyltransferase [Streptacidiphilus pinicola]RAG84680.1 glycosyl transferase [Streptacidiphilus pinicola]
MRIALVTESVASVAWSDRLIASLPEHEFVRVSPASAERPRSAPPVAARRRRVLAAYGELVRCLVEPRAAGGFGEALGALVDEVRGGGLPALLRSGAALRTLEHTWFGSTAAAVAAGPGDAGLPLVQDALVATDLLERALRPLTLPWFGARGALAGTDVCHVVDGPSALLAGLVAKRRLGLPLLLTEHSLHLRERYRGYRDSRYRWPVRSLLLAFHRLLAQEGYAQAGVITPGSAFDQRWQEYCGAERERIRVVYEATPLAEEAPVGAEPERPTLAWLGPIEPSGGLESMIRAFALVHEELPSAVLRVHGEAPAGAAAYEEHCRALARRLFGAEAVAAVSFDGCPPRLRSVYEHATVLVFSGSAGVRPQLLAQAQLSGRPVVAADAGAAREVLGPTGLLVPVGEPAPLAAACSALLGDEERRERLGHAGRLRAQELYAVEPAVDAFRTLYLELAAELPAPAPERTGQPFARPAEYWVGAFPKGVPAR